MMKSNNASRTDDPGIISLGKNIFLIIFAFCIMLSLAWETELLKRFQRIRPAKTKMGY